MCVYTDIYARVYGCAHIGRSSIERQPQAGGCSTMERRRVGPRPCVFACVSRERRKADSGVAHTPESRPHNGPLQLSPG